MNTQTDPRPDVPSKRKGQVWPVSTMASNTGSPKRRSAAAGRLSLHSMPTLPVAMEAETRIEIAYPARATGVCLPVARKHALRPVTNSSIAYRGTASAESIRPPPTAVHESFADPAAYSIASRADADSLHAIQPY